MEFSDLAKLAGGYLEARVLQVAVSLGIFDALKDDGCDAPSVARAIHADLRGTELLLNALAALGLLKKESGLFSLTPVSSTYLVRSSPDYYGEMVLFDSSLWDFWGRLETAVRSGKPVRSPDMYQGDPEDTRRFIYAMHSLVAARGDARVVVETLDLSEVRDFLDVGSGPGTYPIHFCQKHPALRATIFDLPGTLRFTEEFVVAAGLSNHIKLIPGDYRTDPIPGRYQMIFLSNIIHAESGEENQRLMAKLHRSLDPGGKIVIKDHILGESFAQPAAGALFSLLMLLTTEKGRCYSFHEVKEWLEKAGFTRVREIPLPSALTSSLVIGEKG